MNVFNSTGVALYHNAITNSKGSYVFDNKGNKYLDLEAGVWCLPLGHKHPRIVSCIKDQVDTISHVNYRYNNGISEQAAAKLIEVTKIKQGNCIFLSSGSEAVDLSIRIAKEILPNKKCICLSGQYLSAYGYGANTEKDDWVKISWEHNEDRTENEWLELLSDINFNDIGIFVFEAGNSSGIVKLPPRPLVDIIVNKIRQVNGLIVVDEVTCGIGRTGKWFGYMHYNLEPDIIAVGKGLGNGYPISAIVFKESIAKFLEGIKFRYAQSHQNDPLGCRIAYEVLNQIEQDNLLEKVNELGNYLRKGLTILLENNSLITEIRGVGLMNCIQLSNTLSVDNMKSIENLFFKNNIFVGVNYVAKCIRVYMPFIVTKEIIDFFINKLEIILLEKL